MGKYVRYGLVFSLLAGIWALLEAMYLVAYSLPASDGYVIPISSATLFRLADVGKSVFMIPRG